MPVRADRADSAPGLHDLQPAAVMRRSRSLCAEQELERSRDGPEVGRSVALVSGSVAEGQHPNGRTFGEIDFGQVDVERLHREGRFEIVDPVFLVCDRAPARRGDMRAVGRGDAVGDRDVAHDRHNSRHGDGRVGALHDGIDIERRPHEPVGRAVGTGQHRQPADLFPIVVDRQLQVVGRRVGQHLVLPPPVDREPAVDVFEDGAVARGIGDRQVQPGLDAVGQVGRVDAERILRKGLHRFGHGGEIIQYILRPNAQPHHRPRIVRGFVDRFGQEEQVGDQPFFVHAVADADVVAGRRKRAVFRGPEQGVVRQGAAPFDAARKEVEVRLRIFAPVHRATGRNHSVRPQVDRTGAGFDLPDPGKQRDAQHRQEGCFHGISFFSPPLAKMVQHFGAGFPQKEGGIHEGRPCDT